MTKRYEQETIITRAADEAHWQVYTCDGVMKRRMERLAREQGLEVRRVDRYGIEVEVPKDWLKIKPPRVVSAQERERRRLQAKTRGLGVREQRLPLVLNT